MREINGYVFIVRQPIEEYLFGKSIRLANQLYENFETNGLVPFEKISQAKKASKTFSHDCLSIFIGELYMKVAETREEIDFFKDKTNLVVIMKNYEPNYKTDNLFGPISSKRIKVSAYPLPGARLSENRHQPYRRKRGETFSPFELAVSQLKEINRQGRCPAMIAQFKLKILEEVFKR